MGPEQKEHNSPGKQQETQKDAAKRQETGIVPFCRWRISRFIMSRSLAADRFTITAAVATAEGQQGRLVNKKSSRFICCCGSRTTINYLLVSIANFAVS